MKLLAVLSVFAFVCLVSVSGHIQRESKVHSVASRPSSAHAVDRVGYPLSGNFAESHKYVDPSVVGHLVKEAALWSSWKARTGKTYPSAAEEQFRFSLFQSTLERVVSKNARLPKNKPNYGLNKFADMDPAEWAAIYLSTNPAEKKREQYKHVPVHQPKLPLSALPNFLDWSQVGVTTGIKDQGQCGSCWAFSVTETVEGALARANNNTFVADLSEEQIVDCDWANGNQGCNGGDPSETYPYVIQNGLMTEDEYPYLAGDDGMNGTCVYDASKAIYKISDFKFATPPCFNGSCTAQNDILLAQNLFEVGPVGIIVDASQWQDYTWGSFSDCSCDYADMDHGVQVVGFQILEKEKVPGTVDSWQVRNSWGTDWGQDGYITLDGSSTSSNTCGISNEAINAFA